MRIASNLAEGWGVHKLLCLVPPINTVCYDIDEIASSIKPHSTKTSKLNTDNKVVWNCTSFKTFVSKCLVWFQNFENLGNQCTLNMCVNHWKYRKSSWQLQFFFRENYTNKKALALKGNNSNQSDVAHTLQK